MFYRNITMFALVVYDLKIKGNFMMKELTKEELERNYVGAVNFITMKYFEREYTEFISVTKGMFGMSATLNIFDFTIETNGWISAQHAVVAACIDLCNRLKIEPDPAEKMVFAGRNFKPTPSEKLRALQRVGVISNEFTDAEDPRIKDELPKAWAQFRSGGTARSIALRFKRLFDPNYFKIQKMMKLEKEDFLQATISLPPKEAEWLTEMKSLYFTFIKRGLILKVEKELFKPYQTWTPEKSIFLNHYLNYQNKEENL